MKRHFVMVAALTTLMLVGCDQIPHNQDKYEIYLKSDSAQFIRLNKQTGETMVCGNFKGDESGCTAYCTGSECSPVRKKP